MSEQVLGVLLFLELETFLSSHCEVVLMDIVHCLFYLQVVTIQLLTKHWRIDNSQSA